jgi:cytochrome c biogenesis protein CcdA
MSTEKNHLELFKKLKVMNTWKLFFLALITLGVYYAHYAKKQSLKVNKYLLGDPKYNASLISEGLINTVMFVTYISLVIGIVDISTVFIYEVYPIDMTTLSWIETFSSASNYAFGIVMIVWGFTIRGILNQYFEFKTDQKEWFHGLWTFLWPSLYFNYHINDIVENSQINNQNKIYQGDYNYVKQ